MTDHEFTNYLQESRDFLAARQSAFHAEIEGRSRYHFDLQLGTLTLGHSGDDRGQVVFDVSPIGSFNKERGTWCWAWAHSDFPAEARKRADKLRGLYALTGFRVFENEGIHCTLKETEDLTSISVRFLGGMGFFKSVTGTPWLFLCVHGKKTQAQGA